MCTKYLYNYVHVIANQILSPFQSGFVQCDSTTNQLIHTYHTFCESVDNGKEVRTVFYNISGLLRKLFSSYLSCRKQRVVYNGQASDWTSVQAGVPTFYYVLGPQDFSLSEVSYQLHRIC